MRRPETPYDSKPIADVIDDFVLVRGDLIDEYARAQLVEQIRYRIAKAWDEAHEESCPIAHGCPAHDNPYIEEQI